MAEIGSDIDKALQLLNRDELVSIPTETVYGLAGNGLNPAVVVKIFQVKNRPYFDPLILHVADHEGLNRLARNIPAALQQLADRYMPGPLTLLLPRREIVPDLVTSGLPKVALRIPQLQLTHQLLSQLEFPLAAPSANPFGYISPTTAQHVEDQLGSQIPYILDGGPCTIGIESTIVEWNGEQVVIVRKGGVGVEEIESVVGEVLIKDVSTSNPSAPGQLHSHYAPRTPVRMLSVQELNQEFGFLRFHAYHPAVIKEHQRVLSSSRDLAEAARNLFKYLRELDQLNLPGIYVETVPDVGLGRAINDKLYRATQ